MLTVPPTPFPTRRYSDLPMITHSLMSATDSPAMKAAIDHAKLLEKRDDIYAVTVMAGFALADIAAPCLSVIVVGRDQKVAQSTADELAVRIRSEEHTSEIQSLMRISYAVLCLKKK